MSLLTNFQSVQDKIDDANKWAIAILEHTLAFDDSLSMYYYGSNLVDHSGNGKNGTLTGSYSTSSEGITFSGGYGTSYSMTTVAGTFEMYCKVNSNFTPVNTSNWYQMSTLFGCELGDLQQDFAVCLNTNGYITLGYVSSGNADSTYNSYVSGNTGSYIHIAVTIEGSTMKFYINGSLYTTVTRKTSGTVPPNIGLFWNKSGTGTAVKGTLAVYRYFSKVLTQTEITNLYNWTKQGLR